MTSPDGITWTIRNSAANNGWADVTYGNGLFVAVAATGTGNRVMTSPDGITWTSRTSAADLNWASVTYGNGLFVAVAQQTITLNRVMTSPDGITWTIRTAASDNNWSDVTYGNGVFVAVASNGTGNGVMTSSNGIAWTSRTPAANNAWSDVTYANGIFVAVALSGTGNRVMTSPDGIIWTIRTSAADNGWMSVTYGNGLFVAVSWDGTSNKVMTSPDGITWTIRTPAVNNNWFSVTYGNGMFVAVSPNGTGNRVMTSSPPFITSSLTIAANPSNSITAGTSVTFTATPTNGGSTPAYQWKKNSINVGNNSPTFSDATIENGDIVTCMLTNNDPCASPVTSTAIIMAVNYPCPAGVNWTSRTSAANNEWYSVTYGNGLFVAVAKSGTNSVMTSPDGITWTSRTAAANNQWVSVTYGNGLFVAVAQSGTGNRVMTSPNGINWTSRTSAADNNWNSVTYGNGLFVAFSDNLLGFGTGEDIMTSPDGITWTARTDSVPIDVTSVTYGNGLFVAVAKSGTGAGNRVMTSPNGINWTGRTSAVDNYWTSVTYGNGLFVAVASSGTGNRVMTSPDGINWTSRNSAANNQWYSVTCGNGVFVAVANTGTGNRVMTSPDGINWTSRTSAADNFWLSVTFGNGVFVAVGATGTGNRVMTSFPTTLTPSVTIAANPGNNIITGASVTFTATPTNGGSTPVYQWKKNGNNVGINSATYTDAALANGDIITCVLTSNDPCASPVTGNSSGITMAVISPSAITTTGTLSAFTSCSGTASAAQSFTVSGSNLTANLVVTPPTGFELSTTSVSFTSSITLTQISGSVALTTLYVRLKSSATGTPAGNITCASTGATTKNIAVSGIVNTNVTPTFTQVAAICSGATLNALPTTSTNGITGTWLPALNNTSTTTYTFTPTAGQCATTKTMTITVNPIVTPAFTQVSPICLGATLTALPTASTNGITGTWLPALNNTATTTYTFTPNTGQCATTKTMTITVNPIVTPVFTQVSPICAGTTLGALPTTSTNGITGTWSPSLDNTTTTTYTFTPTVGSCATATTMTIIVITTAAPTGLSAQIYAETTTTLASLTVTGTAINWYNAAIAGTLLNNTTVLTNDNTYYAAQTLNGCESSTRLAVNVRKISNVSQTFCDGSTVANLVSTPSTGTTVNWFNTSTGGVALPSSNPLTSGTYYVEEQMPETVSTIGYGIYTPVGLALQSDGKILITENNGVKRMDADGSNVESLGGPGLIGSTGITVQSDGKILVVNSINNAVKRMNVDGTGVVTVGSGFSTPVAIAIQSDGSILVSQNYTNIIKKMNPDGTGIVTLANGFNYPDGMTIQADGKILIADSGSNSIKRVNADGTGMVTLGSGFIWPYGVAVQPDGKILVADLGNNAVKRMNADGTGIVTLGYGFSSPSGVLVLPDGSILVADQMNDAIKKIAKGPVSNRVAVNVIVNTTPAPTAVAQSFCTVPTVANLVATGTSLKWYAASTGGTALASTTPLVTDTTYYVSQTVGTCESTRTAVAVTIGPIAAPTAVAQTFCTSATVSNLVATGTSIKWYLFSTGGTVLSGNTGLTTRTYYVSQTLNNCESQRTPVTVTIGSNVAPTFIAVAPICAGATLAALPTTSTNGVTGTWSPAINNTTTTLYTFTPTAGLCANTGTMTITVNPIVTPTFTTVATVCSGTTVTALPTTSTNSITGTWSPAINNTTTTTYTFTPNAGQCANTTTQTITVASPSVTSAISFVAPAAALPSVTISTQIWTNKNLDVDTYRDGTPIPQVTDPTAWANLTTGAWCYYNNDPANGAIYGKLYNWYAVAGIHDTDPNTPNKILAPLGWHVPSDAEWTTLITNLDPNISIHDGIQSYTAGGKMKEVGTAHWYIPNQDATNSSGFTGLPGGYREATWSFGYVGYDGYWWSSSERYTGYASFLMIANDYCNSYFYGTNEENGFSVRLVKD